MRGPLTAWIVRELRRLRARARPLPGPPLRPGFTLDSPVQIPGVTDNALPECPHGRAGPCGALPDAQGGRWLLFAQFPHYYPAPRIPRSRAGRTVAVCGALRSPPIERGLGGLEVGVHYRPGPTAPPRCALCVYDSPRETPHD